MKVYMVLKNYEYEGFTILSVHKNHETALDAAIKHASGRSSPEYYEGPVKHNQDGIYIEEFEVEE